jgi:hypothetical protein
VTPGWVILIVVPTLLVGLPALIVFGIPALIRR